MAKQHWLGAGVLMALLAACGPRLGTVSPMAPLGAMAGVDRAAEAMVEPLRRQFVRASRSGTGLDKVDFPLTTESWHQLDRNDDGRLDWSELRPSSAMMTAMARLQREAADGLFAETDSDHSGSLSRTEVTAQPALAALQADFGWADRLIYPLDRSTFARELVAILADERLEAPGPASRARASNGRTVFLVHGLWAPGWYYMYPLKRHLEEQGFRVYAMNFNPILPRIEDYAVQLEAVIRKHREAGHFGRVDLIGHSMGGLIARQFMKDQGNAAGVDHYTSLATPHQGSQLAWLAPLTITKQLRPGSDYLKSLSADGLTPGVRHAALWSVTDGMVVPGSNAQLQGALNFPAVKHSNHYLICFLPESFADIDQALAR